MLQTGEKEAEKWFRLAWPLLPGHTGTEVATSIRDREEQWKAIETSDFIGKQF
jgi:hypothetical protein